MAVTIVDLRAIVDEADSTTGWTASAGVAVFTSAPDPVESTGSLGSQVSNALETSYHTISATDYSNTIIYCWLLPGGVIDTTLNGGVQIYMGDASNSVGYHVGGSDVAGFRHSDGPVGWQCFAIDTSSLPGTTTTTGAGFNGGVVNFSAITRIGNAFKTLAKSVGGVENCFMDIMYAGGDGLRIEGGTDVAPGTFADIATTDRSTANATAYGIMRELGTGLFGVQGALTFGNTTTGDSYFREASTTLVFEDRGFAVNKYKIIVEGNSTGNNVFELGVKQGTDEGVQGVAITVPSGVGGTLDVSNNNVNAMGIFGCTLTGFDQGVTFAANTSYEVYSTAFIDCDIIDIQTIQFKNNNIQDSANATGAVLLPSNTTNFADCSFTRGSSGHALYVNPTGAGPFTYDLTGLTYSGYATSNGTTGQEVIYVDPVTSTANVTFNITGGGDTPTIREAAGYTGTVTVNNNKQITLTGLRDNTEIRVFTTSTTTELAGTENATTGTVDDRSFAFSLAAGAVIDIRIINKKYEYLTILNFTVPSNDTSIPISQREDRNYSNP